MTRRFGFIAGAIAGFGLMLFVSPTLHAQTMGEYGGVAGGAVSAGDSGMSSMGSGVSSQIGGDLKSMSHNSQPTGSAHTIEIPGGSSGAVRHRSKRGAAARSAASDDPSTHDWVRVR